jgi:tetratricopeptide (TPR) repeat protein
VTRPEVDDERSFLLRSLEDLDREHAVGDLSDADHAALRDEYVARAAALLRATENGPGPAPVTPGSPAGMPPALRKSSSPRRRAGRATPRPGRRVLVVAGVVVVVAGVFWTVASHVGIRLPGQTATGSVTLSAAQQTQRTLAQAQTLEGQGDAAGAVQLYQSVLAAHPRQEEALAEVGWLEYEAGTEAKQGSLLALGQQREKEAESVDPGAFAPHLYLGSMLLAEGHPAQAVAEYRRFLADSPPRATVASALPFVTKAFADAHQPLPELPVGKAPAKKR